MGEASAFAAASAPVQREFAAAALASAGQEST